MDAVKNASNPAPEEERTTTDEERPTTVDEQNARDVPERNMPDNIPRSEPRPVVMNTRFSVADLSEIYANLRDGNYWDAFRRSISFLNEIINYGVVAGVRASPPRGMRPATPAAGARATATHAMTQEDLKECDRICELLEKQIEHTRVAESGTDDKSVMAPKAGKGLTAADAPEISITDIMSIISMVLDIVQKWRNRNA
jgi:hypothetical protein